FATPINVRLSLLARRKLLDFPDEIGCDSGYVQAGYLWLAATGEAMEALRTALEVQHAEGLSESREAGLAEIAAIHPHGSPPGLVGGAYCHTDGFLEPQRILAGYLDAARRLGARIEWGEEVRELEIGPGGRISRVVTPRMEVGCQLVVNAAGAWAAEVAALAGVGLPGAPPQGAGGGGGPLGGPPARPPRGPCPSQRFCPPVPRAM